MSIHVYNSLTGKKESFEPIDPPLVNMYTCGVTVYDECHIGHARSLYIFDLIRRYLSYRGYQVKLVRNITDIDDKIINRAKELKIAWSKLTEEYIQSYYLDLKSFVIGKADYEPRATENIPEMIRHIEGLIANGCAYITATGVYFRVRDFKGYGKLSGQGIDEMRSGARKEPDETKEDALDFALWKTSKPDEPSWESPWGKGRPGWHIECSVMSAKYLKTETLDIHAGGRDLIFPHHENEIAQSEALTGKPFAKYWLHHGLLTFNGQKMSKSLGNFVTIKEALKRCFPDILKMFYLQAHYSHPIDFSWEKIEDTKKAYERVEILSGKLDKLNLPDVPETLSAEDKKDFSQGAGDLIKLKERFIESMDDDFNTPKAMAALFDTVNFCNKTLDSFGGAKTAVLNYARGLIKDMSCVFGLTFERVKPAGISDEEVNEKINLRLSLKREKKFIEADKLRGELDQAGIILEDTKEETLWRRKV